MSISERIGHPSDPAPSGIWQVIPAQPAEGGVRRLAENEPPAKDPKAPRSKTDTQEEKQEELEEELEDTFPASDPPTVTQPGSTGWDVPKKTLSHNPAAAARDPAWGQVRTAIPAWAWLAAGLAAVPLLMATRSPQRGTRPRLH